MNMTGGSYMNPMYYGGNFVDILFRQIMVDGIKGITLATILPFYMYLSLDYIKSGFKYLNDLAVSKLKSFAHNYGQHFLMWLCKIWPNLKFKFSKSAKPLNHQAKIIETLPINQFTSIIDYNDKIDMLALGNFLLKNKHTD